MTDTTSTSQPAAAAGTYLIGGDLPVARLGFGTMRLPRGTFTGPVRDPEDGIAVLRRAVELGVNHIDTASFYRRGDVVANDLVRRALAPYPDGLVIATKVGPMLGPDGTPSQQATAGQLRGLVEDNLRELGLDHLDLVYLRVGGRGAPGGEPLAERFAALAQLRADGLIRHLGVSNVDAVQLAEARAIAPVAAVQNAFHVQATADAALLAECEASGTGFVPFFPLGGGPDPIDMTRLEDTAARHGATVQQVALAALLAASPVMLPIPGTGSLAHLEENVGAARIQLTAEDIAGLAGLRYAVRTGTTDPLTAQYLHPIAGLDAAIWVPPSLGQLFWVRHAPALFAPADGIGRGLARWGAIALVTPSTNVTGLNLAYQAYLNQVFHRTRLARVGHAVCMPVIVAALLALLYPLHAIFAGALALAAWWAYWAVRERDPIWGGSAIGLAAVLYPVALALGRLGAAESSPLAQPWAWVLLAGALQAGSHVLEPLPPRVTRSVYWIAPAEYLLGRAGHRNRPGIALRRAGQLAAQAVFGTVDEIVASPRLLPVLLLELIGLLGYAPQRRAAGRALSARAIASGNPALDYIGTGGPTPLRAPRVTGRLSRR